jgi:hypothetical protein
MKNFIKACITVLLLFSFLNNTFSQENTSGANTEIAENASIEQTVSFIREKIECCMASENTDCDDFSFMKKYGVEFEISPNDKLKIKLVEENLYFDMDMTMNLKILGPLNVCGQNLYLPVNEVLKDKTVEKTMLKITFTDDETSEEVVRAFVHLKRLFQKE